MNNLGDIVVGYDGSKGAKRAVAFAAAEASAHDARLRIVSTLDIHSFGRDTPSVRRAVDNLRRFHEAGGKVIYGTDLGNGPVPPGIDVRELRLLLDVGLSSEELVSALTRAPLRSGAPADLVGLGADPLTDIDAFGDVRLVVRGGRVLGR